MPAAAHAPAPNACSSASLARGAGCPPSAAAPPAAKSSRAATSPAPRRQDLAASPKAMAKLLLQVLQTWARGQGGGCAGQLWGPRDPGSCSRRRLPGRLQDAAWTSTTQANREAAECQNSAPRGLAQHARTGRGGGAARMTFVGASADLKGFSGASAGADLTDAVKVRAQPRPER